MAITVKCSACRQQFQVRDNLAGKSVVCRECGADLTVPKSRSAASADAEDDAVGDYAVSQRSKAPAAAAPSRKAGSSGSQPILSRRSSDSLPSGRSAPPANQQALWIYLGAGGVLLVLVVLVIKMVGTPAAVQEGDLAKSAPTAGTSTPPPVYTPSAANDAPAKAAPQKKPEKTPATKAARDPDVKVAGKKSPPEESVDPAEGGGANDLGITISNGGVAWKVKVDPPDEPLELDREKKIMATIPKNAARDVIFPDCPSPFVAVGSNLNPRELREIRDIQGNRKIGAVRSTVLTNALAALSPDGQQFAAWPPGRDQIGVWAVKTEKPRGTITAAGNFSPRLLMFAGNKRLIAIGTTDEILVWGMPDGRPERAIPLPKIPGVLVAGLSPGGRYLALAQGDIQLRMIRVFDVTTGSMAGEIRLSGFRGKVPSCHALAFSCDGEELAALYETPEESTLFVFRIAGGQLSGHVPFEDSLQALLNSGIWQGGHALQWFPSRKRLLAYGRGVIDRDAGKLVWTLPRDKSGSLQLGHVLDDERLLVIGTEKQDAAVVVREVPSQ
jgi:hypothetical protein